jgi:hypothetical protein
MSFLAATPMQGLLGLLVLIALAFATGYGLLSLLGFPESRRHRLLLSPVAATMLWALSGDMLVRAGFTVSRVALPIWGGSVALAMVGAWTLSRDRDALRDRSTIAAILGCTLVTIVSMAPALAEGLFDYIGYIHFDSFMYSLLAAGYWEDGIGANGELSFFFQQVGPFALHLGTFRNHTMVLLSLFSPLVEPGEPAFVRGLFVAWAIFTAGLCSAYYFQAKDRQHSPGTGITLIYIFFVMALGWASVPALFGSWDNALFVGLLPLLAGLSFERGDWRLVVVLGVTLGYAFLTYPELCPVLAVIVAPFFLLRMTTGDQPSLTVARHYLAAGAIAALVIAPASGPMLEYVQFQLNIAETQKPGGEFASGLFDQWWVLSSWWGLGTEHMEPIKARHIIGSLFLTVLFIAGIKVTARRPRQPQLWALLPLVPLVAYLWAVERYPYAVFKILSVSWWLIAQVTVDGLVACWRALPSMALVSRYGIARSARVTFVLLLVATGALGIRGRWLYYFPDLADQLPTMHELIDLRDRARLLPPTDVILAGGIAEVPLRALWVWYALRSTPLRAYLQERPAYPSFDGFIWAKDGPPETLLLERGEQRGDEPMLATSRFALVNPNKQASITDVANPNGVEDWGSWLGTAPMTISILARQPQSVELEFEAEPGPSRPESPERTLIVMDNGKEVARTRVTARQRVRLPVSIGAGVTELVLRCVEEPSVSLLPNGDARTLLVAIRALSIRPV